jgi:hypothetical protein
MLARCSLTAPLALPPAAAACTRTHTTSQASYADECRGYHSHAGGGAFKDSTGKMHLLLGLHSVLREQMLYTAHESG